MGIFDKFKKDKNVKMHYPQYLYNDLEIEELDSFISDVIGNYKDVFHEIASPDIHLDVCVVEPSEEEPYYKLVTMGAGAYNMAIPEQWKHYNIENAEYIIYLPKDWDFKSDKDINYWPIKLLKDVARLPIWYDTWLSYGHTTQYDEEGSSYASNTRFNSVVLNYASNSKGDIRLIMSNNRVINFYEIILLYPEELAFKLETDADTLFNKFLEKGIDYKVIDINRKSIIE